MNLVVTGSGNNGSWQVRGVQLGEAIGARGIPKCADFSGADQVICVKHVRPATLDALRRWGKPWVYDIVDAWPQPAGNKWSRDQAVAWLCMEIARLKPDAIVFPTRAMQVDSGYTGPSLVLPHHAWPKYQANVVRENVSAVGYEGGAHYLGAWRPVLERECARRGWRFVVNGDMTQCDIGIALRDAAGYPPRSWKSNCKLANLQALGIPAVVSPERGYEEFGSEGGEYVAFFPGDPVDLVQAFDRLTDFETRKKIAAIMLRAAPRLADVAVEYAQWLDQLTRDGSLG